MNELVYTCYFTESFRLSLLLLMYLSIRVGGFGTSIAPKSSFSNGQPQKISKIEEDCKCF